MSDHDELVAALSECCRCKSFEHYVLDDCVICRAARAIEALVKQRDAEHQKYLKAYDLMGHESHRAEKAEAEVERLKGVLERLGSAKAFTISRALNADKDAELIMRMEYARKALEAKP